MCEHDKEADIDTAYSTVKCNLPHAESVNSTKKRKPTTQLSQPIPKRPSAKDKFIKELYNATSAVDNQSENNSNTSYISMFSKNSKF